MVNPVEEYKRVAKKLFQSPTPLLISNPSIQRWITVLLLVLVYLLGFWVRVDEYTLWKKFPEVFFYDKNPVLANGDGYYYMRMARDLAENQYQAIDEIKKYPDLARRPLPPPLISVLVAWISKLTPLSLEWAGVLLPAVLGPLLILPLWGLCRLLGYNRIAGLASVLIAVLAVQYVNRTRIGFYDTDCLNVTFSLAITYFYMCFGLEKRPRRYLYFILGTASVGLFLWHWDQVPHVVLAIASVPLATAIIFFYRPTKKEGLLFGACCLMGLALAGLWWNIAELSVLWDQGKDFLSFLSGRRGGYFPTTLLDVRELKVPSFSKLIALTTGSRIVLFLSVFGFLRLIFKQPRKSLFLSVIVGLGGLTFFLGNRFAIFLAPVTAIGIGFLVGSVWERLRLLPWAKAALVPAIILCAWPTYTIVTTVRYSPAMMNFMPGIKQIARVAPSNAVIWTTWEVGNALMYYTHRKTICDAQYPEGDERNILAYLPLASDDPRFAANFINFFVKNGLAGVQKVFQLAGNSPPRGMALLRSVLSAGPSDAQKLLDPVLGTQKETEQIRRLDHWLRFFFPKDLPPVFFLLHPDLTRYQGWYLFGNWDKNLPKNYRPFYQPYSGMHEENETVVFAGGKLEASGPQAGLLQLDKKMQAVSQLLIQDGQNKQVVVFNNTSPFYLELYTPDEFGALMDDKIASTTFNRLFIRHDVDSQYFQLVAERVPAYQIWKIKGDQF
jgi:hypothetical protein